MIRNIAFTAGKQGVSRLLLALSLFLAGFGGTAFADDTTTPSKNSDGYYEISTAAELKWFASHVKTSDQSANAVLTADIDLSGLGDDYWEPIGPWSDGTAGTEQICKPYKGKFNGQGHVITGLVLHKASSSGLFGFTEGATISNVTVSGAKMKTTSDTQVTSEQYAVGVICGAARNGTVIENCRSTLTDILYIVRNDSKQKDINYVGGIVGMLQKSVARGCSVDGYVRTDGNYVGGIAGVANLSLIEDCSVNDHTNGHSSVVGFNWVGGIAGYQQGRTRSLAVVDCTVADDTHVEASSGRSGNVCGCDTLIMVEAAWDATYEGYYEIYTPDQLKWFANKVNGGTSGAKARLMNNLNMSKAGSFTPIGSEDHNFSGVFDGQNYTIDSLTIKAQEYAGLFGYVKDGSIKNLKLTNPSLITNDCEYQGIVAGFLTQNEGHATPVGYIENCKVTNGNVERTETNEEADYVGGIVGKFDMSAEVRDCSYQGNVKSHHNYVGGIAGCMDSGAKMYRCTIIGKSYITGNNYVGGVVGYMTDTKTMIDNCFADKSTGTITVQAEGSGYSGLVRGYDKSGSATNTQYNEGGLQYTVTGKKISVGGKEAAETKITGVSADGKGDSYAIVDIGTSNNYFTTEIEDLTGVETLYFWDNCSNIAGTTACGWINMKIDNYAFDTNFKALYMRIRMFAGDDHDVMLRPTDVYPAGDSLFINCPNAKVYVDAEYYDEFCNDAKWGKYKSHLVPTTSMRTEDVNAEYGARYAYDRNRDNTGSIVKVDNGSTYGSSQVHVIGPDNDYLDDESNDNTLWIYQDIGQTYDYNTTKIWASAFKGKSNIKQVKFQAITKSADSASQDFNIAIGDSAFANCKNLTGFNVALYSDQGTDHVELLRPENMPIGKGVFDSCANVKIYVPKSLVNVFKNDTTYGWSQYKDLISEGEFGYNDWTEEGVVYSYYTSEDGQTRYTNENNKEMEAKIASWKTEYRNFSTAKVLEYGNDYTIKYMMASGVEESYLNDNGGKLKLYSDIGETKPNHYKTIALSANGFQDKLSIKSISFEDIMAYNYNTVTNFSLAIPDNTFRGCKNLKELNMFLYVTKGSNHYVAIKPSQVFIGENVFDGVDENFRIKVLPEYYEDFINDANWSQYKDYIVACDYLPNDETTKVRNGVTYDYATRVMNGMSTKQLASMKSSWWNVLTIGMEVAITVATGVAGKNTAYLVSMLKEISPLSAIEYGRWYMATYGKTMLFREAPARLAAALASYGAAANLGKNVTGFLITLEAGTIIAALQNKNFNANTDLGTPLNYITNRIKKSFERPSTWTMSGDWVSTEQITNVPHMYVKSVANQSSVTIYNDCGSGDDDFQTVAIANDAFHNKTNLREVKFQERYGEDTRSLASGLTIALPDSMFKGCTNLDTLNLINYSTGAHNANHCYKGLTPDNFLPMGDIFAGLDETTRSNIHIKVGEEELQEFLDDEYWSQYKDMFVTGKTPIVNAQTEWSCKYALAYDKNTLPLRTTTRTHDIDHVMIYGADDEDLQSNGGLAALINDYGEWNNYKLDYVKAGAFKGNDNLKILDMTDTHTNVADVYDADFNVVLQDEAFADCENFTDLNLIYQVTDGTNHTESMSPSQFTLGKDVFKNTPNLKIKFCLDQEDAFLADTAWVKYKDKFAPCFFEPLDEKVGDVLLDPYRFLTKLNDGTNFDHVDATRAKPEELKTLFKGNKEITSFDEFRAFGTCGLTTIYNGMFSGCDSLQTIMLPAATTTIETDAFKSCMRLHNLTIPAKVTTIEENAFTGSGIKEFRVESATPAAIDAAKAFAGLLNDDYIIYVPDAAVETYKAQWAGVADHINGISQRHGLKEVTLTKAGTLAKALGLIYDYTEDVFRDNHLYGNYAQYDSLRISGPLNGKDIGVIRYMGGRDVDDCDPTVGHLKYLDLYNADLKSEGGFTYLRDTYESKWYNIEFNKKITEDNYIDSHMFYGLDKLQTLILPKTATRIKYHAFRGCSNLQYLVVGDDMKEIDDYVAGASDSKVAMVMLSKNAPEIDYEAFIEGETQGIDGTFFPSTKDETKFNTIFIPEGAMDAYSSKAGITAAADSIITNFKDDALATALKEKHVFSVIDLLNVSDITGYVNGNENVKSFDELYLSGVTTLGDGTLTDMAGLQTVSLPAGLKTITAKAFEGCDSLRTVNAFCNEIPTLEKDVFESLPKDFVVYVTEGEEDAYRAAWPQYKDHIQGYRAPRTAIREVTLTKANTLADSLNAKITMDDDLVVAVGGNLCSLQGLKVSGPIGGKDLALIRYLGGREPDNDQPVFTTNLKYLDLYDADLKADDYYFQLKGNNRKIEEDNVVPKDMLWNCDNLETVILPRTATKLEYEACYDMASLKTLVIGDKTTEIEDDALGENRKLNTIIFLCESKPEIDGDAFTDPLEGANRRVEKMCVRKDLVNDYSTDKEYTGHTNQITTGFSDIEQYRAFGCKAIASEDDLTGITTVEGWFNNFPNLTKLGLLNKTNITAISKNTFSKATGLQQVALPATMSTIEDGAFSENTNLHWLDISECDSIKSTDISKYGVNANALVYVPESFGEQTADNVVDGTLQCAKYNLTSSHDYDVPKAFTANSVIFDRTFAKDNKYALTLPFTTEVPDGAKAYKLYSDGEGKMTFKRVAKVEANKPYVLAADADDVQFDFVAPTVIEATPTRTEQFASSNYAMTGTLSTIANADAVSYSAMTMSTDGVWNLLTADDATDIAPFTAYVQTIYATAATKNVASEFIDYATVSLNEATDNSSVISENNGEYVNAALTRTLKTGGWNTFCVPFDTKIEGTPLAGASVLGLAGIDGNVYSFAKVDSLKAGEPYLVKPKADIANPTFTGVKMNNTLREYKGDYDFLGTYSPMTIDDTKTTYFLGGDGNLKLAKENTTLNGLRAYFKVSSANGAKPALIIDGETITAIDDVEAEPESGTNAVYSVSGMYMGNDINALPSGVYIVNGKKIIK
jgi:hypothetical protein